MFLVVHIYRLLTKGTVEENILERAKKKMVLDHLVIQSMKDIDRGTSSGGSDQQAFASSGRDFKKDELAMILKFGAEELFKQGDDSKASEDVDLDDILARAERREESESSSMGSELLSAFKVANFSTSTETDDGFWNRVIPQAADLEESFLQELPRTRQTRLKLQSDENGGEGGAPRAERQAKRIREISSEIELRELSKKDTRTLIGATKKYGDLQNRIGDIAGVAGLSHIEVISNLSPALSSSLVSTHILHPSCFMNYSPSTACDLTPFFQSKVLEQAADDLLKALRSSLEIADESEADSGAVTIVVNDIPVNALELLQRNEDMNLLGKRVSLLPFPKRYPSFNHPSPFFFVQIEKFGKSPTSFRLPATMVLKNVNWSCSWGRQSSSTLSTPCSPASLSSLLFLQLISFLLSLLRHQRRFDATLRSLQTWYWKLGVDSRRQDVGVE